MKNKKDMIKWLNNLKSDIGQPQHSQLWHYAEILDVIAKYLESTDVFEQIKWERDMALQVLQGRYTPKGWFGEVEGKENEESEENE